MAGALPTLDHQVLASSEGKQTTALLMLLVKLSTHASRSAAHHWRASAEDCHRPAPVVAQHRGAVPCPRPRALPLDVWNRPLAAAERQHVHSGRRTGIGGVHAAEDDDRVVTVPDCRVLAPC